MPAGMKGITVGIKTFTPYQQWQQTCLQYNIIHASWSSIVNAAKNM